MFINVFDGGGLYLNATGIFLDSDGGIFMYALRTTAPAAGAGELWNDAGDLKIVA